MNRVVTEALALWGMTGAKVDLIAARENQVYRVDHGGACYALRLHRRGYRTNAELRSELQWMDAAAQGGIVVPAPIFSTSGAFLHVVQDVQVDVLTWLSGKPLGEVLNVSDRPALFRNLGREMARLHEISDTWLRPDGFVRCKWDREGLLGETPLWDRFWDNPGLTADDRALFAELRSTANTALMRMEGSLDCGLIHADLVSANVMVNDNRVALIDFDDGGFGFRLFDIATALLKHMSEADFPALQAALIDGYRSIRAIDTAPLDLFLVLRAATYVGWNITRMDEDGAEGRNERFINMTRQLASGYLDKWL